MSNKLPQYIDISPEIVLSENIRGEITGEGGISKIIQYVNPGFDITLDVSCIRDHSDLTLNILNLCDGSNRITVNGSVRGDHCSLKIVIISIIGGKTDLWIDSMISAEEGISSSDGSLIQKNIVLGESGKVTGTPGLDTRSPNASMRHSFSFEKVDAERIFYLRSRGISRKEAFRIHARSVIAGVFGSIHFDYMALMDRMIPE